MIIRVKVKAGASLNKLAQSKLPGVAYDLWTTAIREKGKANKAVLRQLAQYLNISLTQLTIKAGSNSNLKTILIHE